MQGQALGLGQSARGGVTGVCLKSYRFYRGRTQSEG